MQRHPICSKKFEQLLFDVLGQRGSDLNSLRWIVLFEGVRLQLFDWCPPSFLSSAVQALE